MTAERPERLPPGHDVGQFVHGPDGLHTAGPLPPGLELLKLDQREDLRAQVLLHQERMVQTLAGGQPVPPVPPEQVGYEVLREAAGISVPWIDLYLGIY